MRARHALLKVFLSEPEFCRLDYTDGDELTDLTVHLDRSKILSHGRPAVAAFLQKLQVFKATADIKRGAELYEGMTDVDDFFAQKVRPAVLAAAQPRKVFCQANTVLGEDGEVELREYEATAEGMIRSFVERGV